MPLLNSFPWFTDLRQCMGLLVLASLLSVLPCTTVKAGDEPFTFASSWGGTGLMEIPTARVMKENHWRFGISQVDPVRTYYGVISPLKGLEIDGRVTEILGTSAAMEKGDFQGYGNNKDKSADLKFQFIPEGKYVPALAVGIMDPSGTRLLASQYIVASKQIYPFDFTLGLGNGRFGDQPLLPSGKGVEIELFSDPKQWWEEARVFAGLQLAPSDKYALMVEYCSILFHKMSLYDVNNVEKYFDEPVPSKVNVGLRWKPLKWTQIDLTYQRGEQLGVNVALDFDMGKPVIPIYDPPYREEPPMRMSPLEERLITALSRSGFSDIGVEIEGKSLWIDARNENYYYSPKAVSVIMGLVREISPEAIQDVNIMLTENRIPVIRFSATRSDITQWYEEKLTARELLYLSRLDSDIHSRPDIPRREIRLVRYGFRPVLETFLNDPSGYFKARLGLEVWSSYHPWKGASFVASLEGYPINNISTVNEPLSIPVRSDIALYKEQNVALGKLMFDQIAKTSHEVYGRISAGILEIEYAGLDGEVAMPMLDGRIMAGISGSAVKKRDPDNPLKLKEDDVKDLYTTAFWNTRFNFPEQEISFDVKAGRFLAGDLGARFTVSKFINGVIVTAWYGITDTSKFTDEYNRGYQDSGLQVTIPLRLLKGEDSRTSYLYSLSPWTRDVAQDIIHYNSLFDFMGRNTGVGFRKDAGEMER